MIDFSGYKAVSEGGSKTIIMDWNPTKKLVFGFIGVAFVIMALAISFSNSAKINHKKVVFHSFSEKLPFLLIIFFVFFLISMVFFLIFYPLKVILKMNSNGNLYIFKRDWFFSKKEITTAKSQNPILVGRKRRMVGARIIIGNYYEPIIRYGTANENKELSLLFTAASFIRGGGPKGLLQRSRIEEISRFLGIKFVIEE